MVSSKKPSKEHWRARDLKDITRLISAASKLQHGYIDDLTHDEAVMAGNLLLMITRAHDVRPLLFERVKNAPAGAGELFIALDYCISKLESPNLLHKQIVAKLQARWGLKESRIREIKREQKAACDDVLSAVTDENFEPVKRQIDEWRKSQGS